MLILEVRMWLHAEYPATENAQVLAGEKKKFLKAEEEPDVLSSKTSGPADPELCKTTRRNSSS